MSQSLDINEKEFTFLGEGSSLVGEFTLKGVVRLSSRMEGTLHILPGGKVTIEREGKFQGTIFCEDIEIFGEFDGILHSQGKVIFQPSSNVKGEISAKSLIIYPGATLNIQGETTLSS